MNPDFMRKVDKFVGIPLCFLFSLFCSFQRLIGLRRIKNDFAPKKILFLELSEMGSTILAYSAMRKARELFNAELYFMIFKENEQSVKILDIVPEKNILTIRSSSFFALATDTLKAIFKMRSLKIDTAIDLELFSRFTSLLVFFSGAKALVGFYKYNMEGLYRGNFLTHRVQYNPYYHISQSFMALVYALTADRKELPLVKREVNKSEIVQAQIMSSPEAEQRIFEKIKENAPGITRDSRIILINPNASALLPIRKWPLENFNHLAEKLLTMDDVYLVITGVESEKPDAQAICHHVSNERCIDFTGKTTLKELIDLYTVSDLLITNDSGPAHFASLTQITIIVFFGPETPQLYSPLGKNVLPLYAHYACSPCVSAFNHRKTKCTNNRCLQSIGVESVFDIVKKIIA